MKKCSKCGHDVAKHGARSNAFQTNDIADVFIGCCEVICVDGFCGCDKVEFKFERSKLSK